MARTVRDAALESREARGRLKARGKPYYRMIEPGLHLGYRKPRGRRGKPAGAGKWVARQYVARSYITETIGVADDYSDPDGQAFLSFAQAQELARKQLVRRVHAGVSGPLTVRAAVEAYLDGLDVKAAHDGRRQAAAFIYPALGDIEVGSLSRDVLSKWLATLAKTPPRKRTKAGKPQQHRAFDGSAEAVRRRRSTANRIWTVLRAALNQAFRDDLVASDPWRRVKAFQKVDAARLRYLTVDEATRLVNASDPAFRALVQAALATGCRYGELCQLEVADFNPDSGTITIVRSKSGKVRHVVLTDEGAALFRQLTAGRADGEIILRKADGSNWRRAHQTEPMRQACLRARIDPPVNFHALRHTWASLSVMNGMPVMIVARNLGHADTRMVEKHYGHLAPSYITDAIRAGAPRFGFKPDNKIAALREVT
jgi:integrase